jgi:hypothetical protein
MANAKILVDPKSYELAEHFLDDFGAVAEALKMQLAKVIQDAVEDWIADAVNDGLIAEETWEEHERRHGFLKDDEPEELDPDRLRDDQIERRRLAQED